MDQRKNTIDDAVEILGKKKIIFMPEAFLYNFPPPIIVIKIRNTFSPYIIVYFHIVLRTR